MLDILPDMVRSTLLDISELTGPTDKIQGFYDKHIFRIFLSDMGICAIVAEIPFLTHVAITLYFDLVQVRLSGTLLQTLDNGAKHSPRYFRINRSYGQESRFLR